MPLPSAAQGACERVLTDAYDRGQLPGVVAAVFSREGLLWEAALGIAASQYRVGSITKTFTAVAMLRLREEGMLDLDDSLAHHVPDAPFPEATLRDLLAHRSGLTAEPVGPWWERSPGVSWPSLAAANASPVHVWGPNARYHYSNLGYGLLGEVVARHREMSWYDAVRSDLLDPLGLHETTYLPLAGAAQGTSRDPRNGVLCAEPAFDSAAMAPAGQLWSTTADLARWGRFLVDGSDDILPAGVLAQMRTAHSADADTQHVGAYGLGLRLRWRATSTLVGHTGSMPGFLAGLFTDSRSGVGAVVLTNATVGIVPEDLAASLVDAVDAVDAVEAGEAVEAVEAVEAAGTGVPAAVGVGSALVDTDLSGQWYWGNTTLTLHPAPDGFRLHGPNSVVRFVRVGTDTYEGVDGYYAGERLSVERRSDGSLSHLEVVTFILTRIPYDPRAPIPGGPAGPLSSPG